MAKNQLTRLTIGLEPELYELLRQHAELEYRTIAAEIRYHLAHAMHELYSKQQQEQDHAINQKP